MTSYATDISITAKQIELDMLHEDYWIAIDLLEAAESPQEKRAYAVLAGLINSLLKKLEQ